MDTQILETIGVCKMPEVTPAATEYLTGSEARIPDVIKAIK
jgi:HupH hydrogenase expression protein, C-terminal conserved region